MMGALTPTERTARSRARRAAERALLRELSGKQYAALYGVTLARTLDEARRIALRALYGSERPQEAAGGAATLPPVSESAQAPKGPVASS